jgi:hypothetical protein
MWVELTQGLLEGVGHHLAKLVVHGDGLAMDLVCPASVVAQVVHRQGNVSSPAHKHAMVCESSMGFNCNMTWCTSRSYAAYMWWLQSQIWKKERNKGGKKQAGGCRRAPSSAVQCTLDSVTVPLELECDKVYRLP